MCWTAGRSQPDHLEPGGDPGLEPVLVPGDQLEPDALARDALHAHDAGHARQRRDDEVVGSVAVGDVAARELDAAALGAQRGWPVEGDELARRARVLARAHELAAAVGEHHRPRDRLALLVQDAHAQSGQRRRRRSNGLARPRDLVPASLRLLGHLQRRLALRLARLAEPRHDAHRGARLVEHVCEQAHHGDDSDHEQRQGRGPPFHAPFPERRVRCAMLPAGPAGSATAPTKVLT